MNLPNKITFCRIILTIIILSILLFPFDAVGLYLPSLFINESIVIEIRYLFVGLLFIFAIITDSIDGKLARKYQMETKIGKVMDDIADKVLIDSTLIVLANYGFISSIIPLVAVITDIIIYSIKLDITEEIKEKRNIKKIRNFFTNMGVVLTLFYNLPFELINFRVADVLLMISSILSVVITIDFVDSSNKYLKMQ